MKFDINIAVSVWITEQGMENLEKAGIREIKPLMAEGLRELLIDELNELPEIQECLVEII